MAFSLPLPEPWRTQGWRAKIRDKERAEPPHVSIIHKSKSWRINLRTGLIMNETPPAKEVPKQLMEVIAEKRNQLIAEWDKMYPHNPVSSESKDAKS